MRDTETSNKTYQQKMLANQRMHLLAGGRDTHHVLQQVRIEAAHEHCKIAVRKNLYSHIKNRIKNSLQTLLLRLDFRTIGTRHWIAQNSYLHPANEDIVRRGQC